MRHIMGPFEIVTVIVVGLAVLAAVGYLIYKKVKGQGGCDCGCGSCHGCDACRTRASEKTDADKTKK